MYPDPLLPATDPYGSSPANGNRQEKRDNVEVTRADGNYIGLYKNWATCWPLNRRIIYNGAAVYQSGALIGQPLAPSKWVLDFGVGGTTANKAGGDVPDGYNPPGLATVRYPFIMLPEGHARIFGPGLEDGPFPEHYEPWETVLTGNVISQTLTSPTLFAHARPERYEHPGNGNPEFPIVGTSYRVTEHWQAGAMTRNLPWQCQLQPEPFIELSVELAGTIGISNGDMVEIKTQRTNYYGPGKTMKARACVTKRMKPLTINGNQTHIIGTIWHFGYSGIATGDSANLLTAHIGDANTGIPESKNFICNIRKNNGPSDIGPWLT
jgi:formate dehydrogenase major subunit